MLSALEDAKKALLDGNLPSASIIEKDGKIIARGLSRVVSDLDPSAHGDLICIRSACESLHTLDLEGSTLYTVIEPCSMCLTCASWANISRIVFGAYQEDISDNSYLLHGYHAIDFASKLVSLSGNVIDIKGGVLQDECRQIMDGVSAWIPKHL